MGKLKCERTYGQRVSLGQGSATQEREAYFGKGGNAVGQLVA